MLGGLSQETQPHLRPAYVARCPGPVPGPQRLYHFPDAGIMVCEAAAAWMDTQERKIEPGAEMRTLQVRSENLKPASPGPQSLPPTQRRPDHRWPRRLCTRGWYP